LEASRRNDSDRSHEYSRDLEHRRMHLRLAGYRGRLYQERRKLGDGGDEPAPFAHLARFTASS
jgi:hypothetical protein